MRLCLATITVFILSAAPANARTLPVHTARAAIVQGNLPFFDGSESAAGDKYKIGHCTRKDPKGKHPRSSITVYCHSYAAEMFGIGCGWWDRARLTRRNRVYVDFKIYTKLECNGDHPEYQ